MILLPAADEAIVGYDHVRGDALIKVVPVGIKLSSDLHAKKGCLGSVLSLPTQHGGKRCRRNIVHSATTSAAWKGGESEGVRVANSTIAIGRYK